VVFIKTVSLR